MPRPGGVRLHNEEASLAICRHPISLHRAFENAESCRAETDIFADGSIYEAHDLAVAGGAAIW